MASRAQLEARSASLPNVEFHDEVDRSIVHGMLHASDCAVVSFHKNALYHHGISPNKLFDYCLFAPRSVIACEQKALTGLEDLVTLRCEPDDPAALAEALVLALRTPATIIRRAFKGGKAIQLLRTRCSLSGLRADVFHGSPAGSVDCCSRLGSTVSEVSF